MTPKEAEALIEQLRWERDIALAQLEEIGVGLGAKMDDIKAAVEKQVKRQWEHEEGLYGERLYTCPVCNDTFVLTDGTMQDNNYNHCPACGQRLEDWDWSEEE